MARSGPIEIEIKLVWKDEEPALWPGMQPTPVQRLWGKVFLSLWYVVGYEGAGVGKTWFWRHVIDFIESQDPQTIQGRR